MPPSISFSSLPTDDDQNKSQLPAPAPAAICVDASHVATRPQSIYGARKASLVLDVIVVGCGIGGLSAAFCLTQAGHRVTIIESSPVLGEIGAGVHLYPNSSRLLYRWGLGNHLEKIAVRPEGTAFKRYNTGERLGFKKLGEGSEREYGAPYCDMHRADLHKILCDLVAPHVTIRLSSTVTGCDPDPLSPSITLKSGEVIRGDLIIGADGVKSCIQQVVSGKPHPAEFTGDAVYRATVPASLMMQDPELCEFIVHPQMTVWLGPGKCMIGYPIRRKELYNLLLLHPDDGSVESRTTEEGITNKMRHDFADFEPRVHRLLDLVKSTARWRLKDGNPVEKWTHETGRVTLLGDACHAMLPFQAQGAAMAIEDGAVLGNLLSRISHPSQLGPLLKAYQDLRLPRTAMAQEASRFNRGVLVMPDGPAQRARDEGLRKTMATEQPANSGSSPGKSDGNQGVQAEKEKNALFFGYDADAEVDKWWVERGKRLEALAVILVAEAKLVDPTK